MPFQMPQLQDNIGNALANIGQIRQQRTQNALAERQIGLSEAAGRRQQQQFDAEQAAAQRAQLNEQTRNVVGALLRVPKEQRAALWQQQRQSLPPELASRIDANPAALDDNFLQFSYNQLGELTAQQKAEDARMNARATAAGDQIIVRGPDGRPQIRYADKFDLNATYDQAPDANTQLGSATTRRGQDISAATTRRGQDISAATTIRGQDMTDRRAGQTGAAADKPTESARLSRGFMMRMQNAERILGQLAVRGVNPGSAGNVIAGATNVTAGPELRQYRQAANDWIRAKLRRESGASIAPDEMQREFETYFPVYGDDPQTIQQKAEARAIATQGMVEAAALPSAPAMPAGGGWSIEPVR